jgi:hypothetical protein
MQGRDRDIKGAVGVSGSEKSSLPTWEQKEEKGLANGKKFQVFLFISYSEGSPFWDYWI